MNYWSDSPLNKAHYYERRAAAFVKSFKYDEALECHASACQELDKSLEFTDNARARESIRLQHEYHKKQRDILKLKKLEFQAYKEAVRVQQEAMSRILKARGAREKEPGNDSEGATIKKAIFRTIEEADSLLELLVQRDEHHDGENKQSVSSEKEQSNVSSGMKRPKDEKTVIEELKIANYQLRSLINELVTQLAESEKEVQALKQRIAELEAENCQLKPESTAPSAYSSPFVFSPSDELLKAVTTELPPLELPNFELTVLHNKKPDDS